MPTSPFVLPTLAVRLKTADTAPVRLFGDGQTKLICPECDETYLHQEVATSFDRREDAPVVTIHSARGAEDWPNESSGNPSPRRQGCRIGFSCELCGVKNYLNIWQHKGETYLSWSLTHDPSIYSSGS